MADIKYSVLTYIFNSYEFVREIDEKDPNAEYILVTDDPNLKSDTWRIVYDEKLLGLSVFDKCYYVRFHPFEYCSTDICFRIDGSIKVKASLYPIVQRFIERNADMMLMINPVFNHLHEDYAYWVKNRNYSRKCAEKALSSLRSLGYDESYSGYYQYGVCIQRNNSVIRELNETSYGLLRNMGVDGVIERFDQPVVSFVLNKYFSGRIKIMPVSEYLITFSKYLQIYAHKSNVLPSINMNLKTPYLFNEIIECECFDYSGEFSDEKMKQFVMKCFNENIFYENRYKVLKKKKNIYAGILFTELILAILLFVVFLVIKVQNIL